MQHTEWFLELDSTFKPYYALKNLLQLETTTKYTSTLTFPV